MANLNYRGKVSLDITGFKAAAKTMKAEINGLRSSFMGFVGGLGASLGISGLVSKMKETATGLNVARATLENVSKGTGEYGENLRFVDQLSKRYHQDLITLTDTFSRFHAAFDQTNFSLEEQKEIYEGLTRAATYFHMSSERTQNMMVAIEQMASKGKITAEELRRQLGNNLPGAYAKMAKAAIQSGYQGIKSFADFEKAMKAGKVGVELLTEFVKNLNEETKKFNTDSLVLKANDLKNAFISFVEGSQFEDFLKGVYDKGTKFFVWLEEHFSNLVKKAEVLFGGLLTVKLVKWLGTAWKAYSSFWNRIIASFPAFTKTLSIHASSWKRILATLRSGITKGGFWGAFVAAVAAFGIAVTDATKKSNEWKKALKGVKDELRAIDSINWKKDDDPWSKKEAAQLEVDKAEKFISEHYNDVPNWQKRLDFLNNPANTSTFSTSAAQMAALERAELENRLNTYEAMKKLYQTAQKRVWALEAEIKQLDSGDTVTTDNTLSDAENKFEKALQKYIGEQKELDNQLKAGAITLAKYNAETNDLVEKSWQSITAFDNFRGEMAKLPADMQKAGADLEKYFGELGLTKSIETLTDTAKDYYNEALKQTALYKDHLIPSEEEYQKALGKAAEKAVEVMYAIKNLGTVISMLDPITQQVIGSIIAQYQKSLAATDTGDNGINAKLDSLLMGPDFRNNFAYRETEAEKNARYAKATAEWVEKLKDTIDEAKKDLSHVSAEKLKLVEDLLKEVMDSGYVDKLGDMAVITEWTEDIKNLEKELKKGSWDAFTNVAGGLNSITSAIESYKKMLEKDDTTYWDRFLSMLDLVITSIEQIVGLVDTWNNLTQINKALNAARESEERRSLMAQYTMNEGLMAQKKKDMALDVAAAAQAKANTAAALAEQSAKSGEAIAGATASGAKLPFPWNLAGIAAGVAAVAASLALIKKFAGGGIVGGNSRHGDKVLAGLNSGEIVMNGNQQQRLWNILNGKASVSGSQGGKVEFVISGSNLRGVLKNDERMRTGRS